MSAVELTVLILATYRLAQVISQDTITEPLRAWLANGLPQPVLEAWFGHGQIPPEARRLRRFWLAYFVHCVVCVSVWAGLGSAALLHWGGAPGQLIVLGLAASGGAVIAGSWLANNAKRN